MNKLYGLLVYRLPRLSGWYSKLHTPVVHSVRSQALCDAFTSNVPDDKLPLFACVVCNLSIKSMFKEEIYALDGDNTYNTVIRDPEAPSGSSADVTYDLLDSSETMRRLYKYLDKDIRERLVAPTWAEAASAVCLQLLRSAL